MRPAVPAMLAATLVAVGARAAPDGPPPAPTRILTLADAVRAARQHQPQLQRARAEASAAGARADQARAPLLPQLDASATVERGTQNHYQTLTSRPSRRIDPPPSLDSRNYLSFDGTATQLLWDFGRTSGRWRAAAASAAAGRDQARAAEVETVLGARIAFFQARAAKDLVAVARAAIRNQDAHLEQIQGFVEVGARPAIDLAQARMDRANVAVHLLQAENGYATARARLNEAMGVDGSIDYDVADEALPQVQGEDGTLEPLVAEAARARPDLAAAEARVEAARRAIGSAQGGYGPSLGVFASGSDRGFSMQGLRWNLVAGATLTWHLFEGGLTRAQVEEARANLDAAVADREQLRRHVGVEVEQAVLTVRAAQGTLGAARDAVDAAHERLGLAEGRYETGAGSALELQDAQLASTAAEAQEVLARYQLAQARAQLLAALGRGEP